VGLSGFWYLNHTFREVPKSRICLLSKTMEVVGVERETCELAGSEKQKRKYGHLQKSHNQVEYYYGKSKREFF
jgi:hypothetical protein